VLRERHVQVFLKSNYYSSIKQKIRIYVVGETNYMPSLRAFIFVTPLFLLLFSSCSENTELNNSLLNDLKQTQKSAYNLVDSFNKVYIKELEYKAEDPRTNININHWLSIARKVRNNTFDLLIYLYDLEKKINNTNTFSIALFDNRDSGLYTQLLRYRDKLLSTDSVIRSQLASQLTFINHRIDPFIMKGDMKTNEIYGHIGNQEALLLLQNIRTNAALNQLKILAVCDENARLNPGKYIHENFVSGIIGQASTILKPGEKLEIIAGVGYFSSDTSIRLHINGKLIKQGDDALAHYYQRTPSKPGKYFIPVKIEYGDQDGKQQIIEARIRYEVSKICDGQN
jgi:hypothetical protein